MRVAVLFKGTRILSPKSDFRFTREFIQILIDKLNKWRQVN